MDITPIFKASIMAVRQRNKNLVKKPETKHKKARDEFSKNAHDICQKINLIKNLLLENRSAYIKYASHLKNSAQMSDSDRDCIDRESEKFFTTYTQLLANLRYEFSQKLENNQHKKHIIEVINMLEKYLKDVNNMHAELKKYRTQYELETYKFFKLASDKRKIPVCPGELVIKRNCDNDFDDDEIDNLEEIDDGDFDNDSTKDYLLEKRNNAFNYSKVDNKLSESSSVLRKRHTSSEQKVALDEAILNESNNYVNGEPISSEDIQIYESENKQLYQELQGLTEEVEQIEKNVVDIAKLQEIFTEKVVMQKGDIERIANAVVGATENVKDANDQIKQAIQRNAGLRVWALFFLLIMSFTLLFLDWYNE